MTHCFQKSFGGKLCVLHIYSLSMHWETMPRNLWECHRTQEGHPGRENCFYQDTTAYAQEAQKLQLINRERQHLKWTAQQQCVTASLCLILAILSCILYVGEQNRKMVNAIFCCILKTEFHFISYGTSLKYLSLENNRSDSDLTMFTYSDGAENILE